MYYNHGVLNRERREHKVDIHELCGWQWLYMSRFNKFGNGEDHQRENELLKVLEFETLLTSLGSGGWGCF